MRTLAGRFELGSQAQQGGMASVHRAWDRVGERHVALKLLTPGGEQARLLREAEVLAALAHPRIVRYVAHGVDAGQGFLAMAWLEGRDLAERLTHFPLGVEATVGLGRDLCEALAIAHQHGVVHRDLKPANIFLPGDDLTQVMLIDFGIARLTGRARGLTLSRSGPPLGTPGYMAPEQIRGSRALDGRADLFALGCVLYECLTGCAPFVGSDGSAVLAKILFAEAPRLRALLPAAPAALEDLLVRLLAKDPAHRPASAHEVAAALSALEGGAAPAPPARPLYVLLAVGATAEPLLDGQSTARSFASAPEAAHAALEAQRPDLALALIGGAPEALAEAIDRAAGALRGDRGRIWLDDAMVRALAAGHRIAAALDGGWLLGVRAATPPTFLERRSALLGRDAELARLLEVWRGAASRACALVLQGPAGIGKTRLRRELVAALGQPQIMTAPELDESAAEVEARLAATDGPILVIAEDAHELTAGALAILASMLEGPRPLLVLLLTRGEPPAWPRLEVMTLRPLVEAAVQRLLAAAPAPVPAARVAEAAGNPGALEELVREQMGATVPARIDALSAPARLALGTAAIFGARCWSGAVADLDELVRSELLFAEPMSRFAAQDEYRMASEAIRCAARERLSAQERSQAHRHAAAWLANASPGRALREVAEHLDQAGHERAGEAHREVAVHDLSRQQPAAALAAVARGLPGATPEVAGRLQAVAARAHLAADAPGHAVASAEAALASLVPGTAEWFAMLELAAAGGHAVRWLAQAAGTAPHDADAAAAQLACLAFGVGRLADSGDDDLADTLATRAEALFRERRPGAAAVGALKLLRARLANLRGEPALALLEYEAAGSAFRETGDAERAAAARLGVARALADLGQLTRARELLAAEPDVGPLRHARSLVSARIDVTAGATVKLPLPPHAIQAAEAVLLMARGADGVEASERALAAARPYPRLRLLGLAIRAQALLRADLVAAALPVAREALALLSELAGSPLAGDGVAADGHDAVARVAIAATLAAAGDAAAAEAVLTAGRIALRARAAGIPNPHWRDGYLTRIPDHVQLLG